MDPSMLYNDRCIREMTADDITRVVEVVRASFLEAHKGVINDEDLPTVSWARLSGAQLEKWLSESSYYLGVVDAPEIGICGFTLMVEEGGGGRKLAALYVQPDQQGNGWGTHLYEAATEAFPMSTNVTVDIFKNNLKTMEFFKHHKFEIIGEGKVKVGKNSYDMVRLQRHLV